MAMGMPASGLIFPCRISPSAFCASSRADSFRTVVKEWIRSSTASMRRKTFVTISAEVASGVAQFVLQLMNGSIEFHYYSLFGIPTFFLFDDLGDPEASAALVGRIRQRHLGGSDSRTPSSRKAFGAMAWVRGSTPVVSTWFSFSM